MTSQEGRSCRQSIGHEDLLPGAPALRARLGKLLATNQICDSCSEDIAIYRERGVIVIDAGYEKRSPLFWVLDGAIIFDDLVAEAASMSRT